jgi:hypothetical protein
MITRREQRFILTGYSGRSTPGTVTVVAFDRRARIRRALGALGTFWGCALGAVFIPVAHFLLVPGFFGFGIVQCVRRLGTHELGVGARGTCPDCGFEQRLELPSRWAVPQQVTCRRCQRGLTLRLPDSAP